MTGLEMKYFVLKPDGVSSYHLASRNAILVYATTIANVNPELAKEIAKLREKIKEYYGKELSKRERDELEEMELKPLVLESF